MSSRSITVLLVDSHSLVRQSYRSLLAASPDLQVVGEATNSAEAIEQESAVEPDVTVIDVALPGVNGIETTKRIVARRPAARVLMVSLRTESVYIERAFQAGAMGYLSKVSAPELLIEAVRTVADGQRYMGPDL